MRTIIKGGVWKNSEDEILKAAVMKYGLNNWSRVASLLVRKSAKQCKSRWYEWLDPSVKKTEWSRDEEEKLLHLAKLFPNQWRTIAPLVGRTAHQCLDHYDHLLDQAQGRTDEDSLNDPRRLRPGEIDPRPETKPSRADAIDMEDVEKEMLAEARARLANTRGKKAKRKAREKQLEEARRLAVLQKKRELKAAGIVSSTWKRRKTMKEIDYDNEVPFEMRPAPGAHPVGAEETPEINMDLSNASLQKFEGQQRIDEERRLRKQDARKLKALMVDDLPEAMKLIDKANDPPQIVKISKLQLPEAQLAEDELTKLIQLGSERQLLNEAQRGPMSSLAVTTPGGFTGGTPGKAAAASSSVRDTTSSCLSVPQALTAAVLSAVTPMREDRIRLESILAAARVNAPTPLLGDEMQALPESTDPNARRQKLTSSQGNAASCPTPTPFRTPNPLATLSAGITPVPNGVMTGECTPNEAAAPPSSTNSAYSQTPLRVEQLSGRFPSSSTGGALQPKEKYGSVATYRSRALSALERLPAPQNEVEVIFPSDEAAGTEGSVSLSLTATAADVSHEEDAEDRLLREQREAEEQRQRELLKESQVIRQCLPRPAFPEAMVLEASSFTGLPETAARYLQAAEAMLHDEMRALVINDAVKHPVPIKGLRIPKAVPPLEDFGSPSDQDHLADAQAIIRAEVLDILDYCQIDESVLGDVGSSTTMRRYWEENAFVSGWIFDPTTKSYVNESSMPQSSRIEAMQHQFNECREEFERESVRRSKLEKKLDILTRGYISRAKAVQQNLESLASSVANASTEHECFENLEQMETAAIESRREALKALISAEKRRHETLQMHLSWLKPGMVPTTSS